MRLFTCLAVLALLLLGSLACGGSEELPTPTARPRSSEPKIDVEATVEYQVSRTLVAQEELTATKIAQVVDNFAADPTPQPTATPAFERVSRIPLFRRPTLVAVALPTPLPPGVYPTEAPPVPATGVPEPTLEVLDVPRLITHTPVPVTPVPTATPRGSAPRATPRPAPTPSPAPAATLPAGPGTVMVAFTNSLLGFSGSHPEGWRGRPGQNVSAYYSPDQQAVLEYRYYALADSSTLPAFARYHQDKVEDKSGIWSEHEIVELSKGPGGDYWDFSYERVENPGDCVHHVTDRIFLSEFYPSVRSGYVVSLAVCGDSQEYAGFLDRFYDSFMELN